MGGLVGSSLLCRLFASCGKWRLLPSCGAQTSHYSAFFCCGTRALGHAGLGRCGFQALEHRLNSYSVACGIFLDQELNPCLLHWQVDSLPLSRWGSTKIRSEPQKRLFLQPYLWETKDPAREPRGSITLGDDAKPSSSHKAIL